MRIAEDVAAQQLHVPAQLRLGVDAAARVVEVHVVAVVEPPVFPHAQIVEDRRRLERRATAAEGLEGGGHGVRAVAVRGQAV